MKKTPYYQALAAAALFAFVLSGCGKKEEPELAAPEASAPAEPAPAPVKEEPGGWVPPTDVGPVPPAEPAAAPAETAPEKAK